MLCVHDAFCGVVLHFGMLYDSAVEEGDMIPIDVASGSQDRNQLPAFVHRFEAGEYKLLH